MHTYRDHDGTDWPAVIDPRSVRKVGRAEFANFCVLCPMPQLRTNVKLVKKSGKLAPHTAKG